ncbi:MAG: hypothetical protein HYV47_02535 [Candidatus Nealsonbacteria bacterium]|nr:hypothetical protein [Candidatus Nealsonbacteria bacterium]
MNEWIAKRENGDIALWLPSKIVLAVDVFGDMLLAARISLGEVSGFAKVQAIERSLFISNAIVPYQDCSDIKTSIFGDNFRQAIIEFENSGGDRADVTCWWHSHADGPVFFSEKDDSTIDKDILEYLRDSSSDEVVGPFISLVINRRAEIRGRYDFARPALGGVVPVVLAEGAGEQEVRSYLQGNFQRMSALIGERVAFFEDGGIER